MTHTNVLNKRSEYSYHGVRHCCHGDRCSFHGGGSSCHCGRHSFEGGRQSCHSFCCGRRRRRRLERRQCTMHEMRRLLLNTQHWSPRAGAFHPPGMSVGCISLEPRHPKCPGGTFHWSPGKQNAGGFISLELQHPECSAGAFHQRSNTQYVQFVHFAGAPTPSMPCECISLARLGKLSAATVGRLGMYS